MVTLPVLVQTTDEELFAELRRRGFQIVPKRSVLEGKWVEVSKPTVDEASMDFDKWMRVVELTTPPFVARFSEVYLALQLLIDLLQPASVREARKRSAEAE